MTGPMRNRPFVEMGSTSSTFTGELAGGVRFEDSTGTPVYEEVADFTSPDDVSSFSYDHSVELPEVFQKLSKLSGIIHRQLPFWGQTALDLLTGQYPFVITDVGMFLAGRRRSKRKRMVLVESGNGQAGAPTFFPHPLTGEPVPVEELTHNGIKRIISEIRREYQTKLKALVYTVRESTNEDELKKRLASQVDVESERALDVEKKLDAILDWYGQRDHLEDFYKGAMRHRIMRVVDAHTQWIEMLSLHGSKVVERVPVSYSVGLSTLVNDIGMMFNLKEDVNIKGLTVEHNIKRSEIDNSNDIDFEVLEEIVEELIVNAYRYADSSIKVEWDAATRSLVVINDGPGIPKGLDVFKAGVRGNHPGIEGTGFGLSNAKADAEAQGWELTYTSEPGRTEFRLRIPERDERIRRQADNRMGEYLKRFNELRAAMPSREELANAEDKAGMAARLNASMKKLMRFVLADHDLGLDLPKGSLQAIRFKLFRHSLRRPLHILVPTSDDIAVSLESDNAHVEDKDLRAYETARTIAIRTETPSLAVYINLIANENDVELLIGPGASDALKGAASDGMADVINNLVTNTAKYHLGPRPEKATLDITFVPSYFSDAGKNSQYNGLPALAFKNNAGGMPPEVAEKIGKEQVHGDPTKPGSGEGLLLSYQLIEKMGGHIWFETTPGVGTTFYIWLPEFDGPR